MKGRLGAVGCALLFLVGVVGSTTPASAGTTGVIAFAGTVTLPAFPCGACAATFTSTAAAGLYGTVPVTRLSASVNYSDTCTAGQPLTGIADSNAFVQINSPAMTTGTQIHWVRTGLVAVISTGTGSLDTVNGAALFVPTSIPSCASPGAVTAAVAGAVITS